MYRFLPRSIRLFIPVVAVLALFSLVFTTTYAQETDENPMLTAARQAGLVTDIGSSQTVGDVTVTLDWAYADTQGLMVGYTIQTDGTLKPDQLLSRFDAPHLMDDKGASFSYATSSTAAGAQPNTLSVTVQYYSQAMISKGGADVTVNNDYFNPPPDTVKLTFDLTLGGFSPTHFDPLPEGSPKPADYVEPVGPFTYTFSVPLHPAVIVETAQSIQAQGVEVTLKQVVVTPSKTAVRICYTLPDARDWMPNGSVTLDNQAGLLTGIAIVGSKETAFLDSHNRCRDLTFDLFTGTQTGTLNIKIDHLEVSASEGPETWNKIKAELAKHDIQIEVVSESHGLSVNVLHVPDGVDYDKAVIAAREALGDWREGPWQFEVTLPKASS